LNFTTRRRIPASTSTNQGLKKAILLYRSGGGAGDTAAAARKTAEMISDIRVIILKASV